MDQLYGPQLQLVVRKDLSVNEINQLVGKRLSLASFTHHSPQAMGVLLEKQKPKLDEAFQGHKLITDCPTRWNSTNETMARLSEQMPAQHAVASDKSGKYSDLWVKLYTLEEEPVIKFIIKVLKPFKVATEIMSAEEKPTLLLVSPIAIKVGQAHIVLDNDIPLIENEERNAGKHKKGTKQSNCSSSTWHQPVTHAQSCSISSLQRNIKLHGQAFSLPVRRNSQFQFPVLLFK